MLFLCVFLPINDISTHNVALANSVIALLGGATTALTDIAYNAYCSCISDTSDTSVLAERFYYEQRKSALEKIKDELVTIKNGLEVVCGLSSVHFTYRFLHQHIYSPVKSAQTFSITQEKSLSDEQKNKLTKVREYELTSLEKQIQDIQFLLALHANQLINNVQQAQALYDSAIPNIEEAIIAWNNNLNAMTYDIAVRLYKYDLQQECLLQDLHQAIDELILVAEYYRICKPQSIQEATTILLTLNHIIPVINEKKQWILQQESCVRNNITIAERYFAERAISEIALKNQVQKEFANKHKEREAQVLQKNRRAACQ